MHCAGDVDVFEYDFDLSTAPYGLGVALRSCANDFIGFAGSEAAKIA